MKTIAIGSSRLVGSRLAYGCWRIAGTWNPSEVSAVSAASGRQAVLAAYEAGYTLFDHADIYCRGEAERIFGQVLKDVPGMRGRILIADKCGIRAPGDPTPGAPYRYDFSADHIVQSCEKSLARLGVETIDLYQLHRPDYLMNPAEVADAFERLHRAGKVREFGVSNFRPSQVTALQSALRRPLRVNQVEISLGCLSAFEDGTLDQCLALGMTPMAWSPLAGGQIGNGARRLLPSQEGYNLSAVMPLLESMAHGRGVSPSTVALAWLLMHPAGIVPIVGSTRPEAIREAVRAVDIELSREDWYRIFEAARGSRLP